MAANRRLSGTLFLNCPRDALGRDVVSAFVRVEKCIEAGDALAIRLTPVDDAPFRARNSGVFEETRRLPDGDRVMFGAFQSIPNTSELFRIFRSRTERFRIIPHVAEGFRSFRNSAESFRMAAFGVGLS